jgi:hypothetical protein
VDAAAGTRPEKRRSGAGGLALWLWLRLSRRLRQQGDPMSVEVGQLDLTVEGEGGGAPQAPGGGAPASPDAQARTLRALNERLRRDRARTHAEAYDD